MKYEFEVYICLIYGIIIYLILVFGFTVLINILNIWYCLIITGMCIGFNK